MPADIEAADTSPSTPPEHQLAALHAALKAQAKERQDQTKHLDRDAKGRLKPASQTFDAVDKNKRRTDAKLAGTKTNRTYISQARKLRDEAPELAEQVRKGEKTIPQAMRELKGAGDAKERPHYLNRLKANWSRASLAERDAFLNWARQE